MRASVIVSAAREKALAPCTASLPNSGVRQTRIRQGMNQGRKAPVLNSTIRSNRSRSASRAPSPMAPPQSWATSVTRCRSSASISRSEVVDVIGQPQRPRLQVAQAAAEVIGRHAAVAVPQREDQPPPVERPRGIAVDEQQRRLRGVAVAFVEVVQARAVDVEPVRRERIQAHATARRRRSIGRRAQWFDGGRSSPTRLCPQCAAGL